MMMDRLDDCPAWCEGHVEDEAHYSTPATIPAVTRTSDGVPRAVELAVVAEASGGETWVWLSPDGESSGSLVLSAESARRMHAALGDLIRQLG